MKVAINGFGRMGKLLTRLLIEQGTHEIVYINDPACDAKTVAHLLAFDSVQGRFKDNEITSSESQVIIENSKIDVISTADLNALPVDNIDLLIDCSGKYRQSALFQDLLNKGLKKVLVACPVKDDGAINLVYGVNHQDYDARYT